MAHDQGGSEKAGVAAGGKDDLSQKREPAQSGRRHGEQASQIAGGQGQRNEQSRHQDQAAQTSREQK